MRAFAKSLSDRPMDMEQVALAREKVREVGGEGLLVEAACIAAGFTLMTRVVDATGRKVIPNMIEKIRQTYYANPELNK